MHDPFDIGLPPDEREVVAGKNRAAMAALQKEWNLFIPQHTFDNWRPTVRTTGSIVGVKEGLTIIATDGVMAYFLTDGVPPTFYGHIQRFSAVVQTLYGQERPLKGKTQGKKPSRKSAADRAQELLQRLLGQKKENV